MAKFKKLKLVTRQSMMALMSESEEKQIHVIGRALVAIFSRQTKEEKTLNSTRQHNNIGFSGHDGKSGSLTAKYYIRHGTLLPWQVELWTRDFRGNPRITKYAKQLNEVALENKIAKLEAANFDGRHDIDIAICKASLPDTHHLYSEMPD